MQSHTTQAHVHGVCDATYYLLSACFTQAYLRRRPCCGNGCRHCPWGHANVPAARRKPEPLSSEDEEDTKDLEW